MTALSVSNPFKIETMQKLRYDVPKEIAISLGEKLNLMRQVHTIGRDRVRAKTTRIQPLPPVLDGVSSYQQVVNGCWNPAEEYFQTSHDRNTLNYFQRDFTACARSLMRQGYRPHCRKTMEYALKNYSNHGRTATTVFPDGSVSEVFWSSVDTVPSILKTFQILLEENERACDTKEYELTLDLLQNCLPFLQAEVARYQVKFVNPKTGDLRLRFFISEQHDNRSRIGSTYAQFMLPILKQSADFLQDQADVDVGVRYKLKSADDVVSDMWTDDERIFWEDVVTRHYKVPTVDTALLSALWLGVLDLERNKDHRTIVKEFLQSIRDRKMHLPVPAKPIEEAKGKIPRVCKWLVGERLATRAWVPNYTTSITAWDGANFGNMVAKIGRLEGSTSAMDEAKLYAGQFALLRRHFGNVMEKLVIDEVNSNYVADSRKYELILNVDGTAYVVRPYETPHYLSVAGIIWAALLEELDREVMPAGFLKGDERIPRNLQSQNPLPLRLQTAEA